MKSKVIATSNAVLSELDGENESVVCIIVCKKDEDLTAKIKEAIKGHHIVDSEVKITEQDSDGLTNQDPAYISAEWESTGEPEIREFVLRIVTTYQ